MLCQVCVDVPSTVCSLSTWVETETSSSTSTQRCDTTEQLQFQPQQCNQDSTATIEETKQMPDCRTEIKQQCDSRWEINAAGEKVWAGDFNCQDVEWENCQLVDRLVVQEVPTWTCRQSADSFNFFSPVYQEEEAVVTSTVCKARGAVDCGGTSRTECSNVEWEDCYESVEQVGWRGSAVYCTAMLLCCAALQTVLLRRSATTW